MVYVHVAVFWQVAAANRKLTAAHKDLLVSNKNISVLIVIGGVVYCYYCCYFIVVVVVIVVITITIFNIIYITSKYA